MSERAAKVTPPDDEQDDDQITDSAAPDAATEDDAAAGDAETTPAPVTSGAEAVVRARSRTRASSTPSASRAERSCPSTTRFMIRTFVT